MSELQNPAQTMTPDDLLRLLRERGVQLSVESGRLKAAAPAGALGGDLQALIRQWKSELIELLAAESPVVAAPAAEGSIRLSPAQERLWLYQQLELSSTAYNLMPVVRIEGPLDSERLERALRSVLARHEPLRSRVSYDGTVSIGEPPASVMTSVDLSGLDENDRSATVLKLLKDESGRPFDLARDIPFRALLLRLEPDLHELATSMHHIAVDGVSLQNFYLDLARFYSGQTPEPLRATYSGYAQWQRTYWTPDRLALRGGFWREVLAGAPRVLELPVDQPRGPRQTFTGAVVTRTLTGAAFDIVKDLAKQERASLFMVLLAALSAALHRQSGQRDMVIGTPLHGRDSSELSDLVGMFVNQLPLRMRVAEDATFRGLVRAARETALGSMAEHEMPFGDIVEALGVPRDASRTPLFQVMLNVLPGSDVFAGLPAGDVVFRLPDVQDLLALFDGQSKFDMTLYAIQRDESLHIVLNYNCELFAAGRMKLLLDSVCSVLESASTPDSAIDDTLAVQQRPLLSVSDITSTFIDDTVVDRVARHAALNPDHPAVLDGVREYTYAELIAEARRIALLVSQAAADDVKPVGVMVPHDARATVAILGALTSGRPYVPLDPEYPEERLRFMAEDAGVGVLLTTESMRERAAAIVGGDGSIVTLEQVPTPTSNRPSSPAANDLAYLLYTSGSTGRPKAVMQSHRNLLAQAERYASALEVTSTDRLALIASISFDASLMDLFGALLRGASVHTIDPKNTDLSRLPVIAEEAGLTTLHVTPTVFRTLARTTAAQAWPTVRAVILGGEPVRVEDVAYFDDAFSDTAVLLNLYGASEHSFSLGHFVDRTSRSVEIPIGLPLGDVEVLLLNEDGSEDPVKGEIAIRSSHTALGYWHPDERAARTFVADNGRPGQLLYRTGDLGRRRPDGLYVALGRVDSQMKVRGHRIEPHEIESVLKQHPDVADAGVHAPAGADGERSLVACYAFRHGASVGSAALAAWCTQRLPGYMVPAFWIELEALPRTPSGKIDRRALPSGWDSLRPTSPADDRGVEEQVLRQIWCDVLSRGDIGIHDDFFLCGGHSLTATQVVARTRDLLDVDVPLRVIFDQPTIAGIASWIRENRAGHVSLPPLNRVESVPEPMPMSFAQERMWLIQQMDPENVAYNMFGVVRLLGALDIERLRLAVDRVRERQQTLRTHFPIRNGVATQAISDQACAFTVEHIDPAASDPLAAARERALDVLEAEYDLANGPLLRIFVARLAENDHLVAVGMHHIISDIWSFAVLGKDVAAAYNDPDTPLSPLPVTYQDYTLWQRGWLQGDLLRDQISHWRDRLGGLEPLELPTDYIRPQYYSFKGQTIQVEMPAALRAGIERVAAENRATPFMVTLAAFNALLAAYTGQSDIAVGVPVANRTQTATEEMIGAFVNTLVHRNQVLPGLTFRSLLASVRSNALDAFAHQDTPFEALVKELHPARDASRPALVQVLFNLANVSMDSTELAGLRREVVPLLRRNSQFELTLNVALNSLQSDLVLTFNATLFSRATVERLLNHYVELLERVVANPDISVAELQHVAPADRSVLLETWNDAARDYPATSVPALVEATAQRTPAATAVESPTGTFTYAELVDYSRRVTAALQAMGVSPGDRVAIVMQRSREMLGALIGIMGAGASYVPVDPNYPAARVQYMLENSGAVGIVSHRGLEQPYSPEVPVLDLDRWTQPPPAAFVTPTPDQAAYAIYTSGSTGKPKGVEISHGAMTNFLLSMQERPGMKQDDALLAVTTISFDIAVLELYLPLLAGARVVIAGEDEALDGRRLMGRMEDAGITVMQATPATWKLLVAAGWAGKRDLRVLCGGEPLSRTLADELLDRVAELWNMYGPTETTVWSTVDRIERDAPILVGRPIANTTLYVLDDSLALRPIGVPGELYIGGAGVANGYVNRPDLTEERFIASPFREGERLYRTGDLVRYRHDGRVEHLGRLDGQVKIRGFRIELGEVESAIQSHEAVRDAVAVAADDRLVAYVVFEPGMNATITDLRTWVGSTLPPYMVPSFIVPMEALPLTPNGKVDRKQLPDPTGHAPEPDGRTAPEDPMGRVIAEVWSTLLGIDGIGSDDNFFEIGGHSLLAMEAVSLIEERTGHRIEPRSLFFMSLAELAASIPLRVEA